MTEWTKGAVLFAVALGAIMAITIILAALDKPADIFPNGDADRWAAEAAIMGFGAVLLAAFAALLAFMAYVNSTEKPNLALATASWVSGQALLTGKLSPLGGNFELGLPVEVLHDREAVIAGKYVVRGWRLYLVLQNAGKVAARYIAIRVTLTGAHLEIFQLSGLQIATSQDIDPWKTSATSQEFWWEGGVDAIIHPNWSYPIPILGNDFARLIYTDLSRRDYSGGQTQWLPSEHRSLMKIEVIADDHPVRTWHFSLHFELLGNASTTP